MPLGSRRDSRKHFSSSSEEDAKEMQKIKCHLHTLDKNYR